MVLWKVASPFSVQVPKVGWKLLLMSRCCWLMTRDITEARPPLEKEFSQISSFLSAVFRVRFVQKTSCHNFDWVRALVKFFNPVSWRLCLQIVTGCSLIWFKIWCGCGKSRVIWRSSKKAPILWVVLFLQKCQLWPTFGKWFPHRLHKNNL